MAKANDRRAKDQAMAGRLRGTYRKEGRCPICNRLVPNAAMENHIGAHSRQG